MKTANNRSTEVKKAELLYQTQAQLGEGAFWDYQNQIFFWVDIEGKQLHYFNPKTSKDNFIEMPSRIGTVVPIEKNKVVVALEDGIYEVDLSNNHIFRFSDIESTLTDNRFNDGKCDPAGNLWVGSMHLNQEKGKAKLYKIDSQGNATTMLENVTISNGIVWSSDKKTMYYIDTPTKKIMAYDFDVEAQTISNERVAVEVDEKLGFPDGMAIDENDHLWVGMWNGNAVLCFDPISGKVIDRIEVPAHNVTSCAFGGENLEMLYITSASIDMTETEKKKFPLAGSLFVAKPGVKGVKSTFFKKGE
ncbi:SMP-30/gluconolactonase/LRE family protein [Namhaeicola litoreus]|uniref:SMP-30/gluconolactonase/LRE family protein n=1 Tax=Namhaeicola litoreus TaxID=1052145 RepID=A0ABW3Y564_9FLAO